MAFFSSHLHQSVFPILPVQGKGLPDEQRSATRTYPNTEIGTYPGNVKYHDQDQDPEQAACENEQILRLEPLEFHGPANAFVDVITAHNKKDYRKKDLRIVAATIRKIQAPNQLAAVLLVSGSPLLNLL